MTEGFHTTHIECRICHHGWRGILMDNAIVGKTQRLVCSKCRSRDIAVSLSWTWGTPAEVLTHLPGEKKPGTRPG